MVRCCLVKVTWFIHKKQGGNVPHEGQKDSRSAGALAACLRPTAITLASKGGPITICTPYMGTPGLRHGQYLAQGHSTEGAECLGFEPGSADS